MFKKIILITSFLVFSGVMVIGAIYRSEARINLVASTTLTMKTLILPHH